MQRLLVTAIMRRRIEADGGLILRRNEGRSSVPVTTDRIETLVDGVFGIAMTILVLDLKAPPSYVRLDRASFLQYLGELGDPLMNFGISFLLLSLFWIWHHAQSHEIRRTNIIHLWINLLLLAFVCFIPLTTSMMSRFTDIWEADMLFHLNVFSLGFLLMINWWYATWDLRLVDSDIDAQKILAAKRRSFVPPLMALIGMALSFFVLGDSNIIYLLTPIAVRLAGKGFSRSGKQGRDIRE